MNEPSLQLIVGLGNPDKNLLGTRHNVGFWFLDFLSVKFEKNFILSKKFESELFDLHTCIPASVSFLFFFPPNLSRRPGAVIILDKKEQ